MRTTPFILIALLAGCAMPPSTMTAKERADRAANMTPLGAHPPGVRATFPPADPSFKNLNCTGGPQNSTVCTRDQ